MYVVRYGKFYLAVDSKANTRDFFFTCEYDGSLRFKTKSVAKRMANKYNRYLREWISCRSPHHIDGTHSARQYANIYYSKARVHECDRLDIINIMDQ